MKDYSILRFLDLFKGIFTRLGIDYPSMRKIIQVKLVLDSRRISTVMQGNTSKKDEEKNNFYKSFIMYFIFGLLMIPFVLFGDNYLFKMTLVFGMFMFFMMTTLISDFSSVLLDLRDKEIILSKPINSKTLNMAKIIHIIIYTSMITMAMIIPSLIAGSVKNGILFFIIYLVEVVLINLFLIVLTGLIYLLILRFFDGEKLRDIINYVQIGLTITITVGYQLIGRVFDVVDLTKVQMTQSWWSFILPPIWFAAPFEFFINNNKSMNIIIYSLLALIIPIIAIIIYVKTTPAFERNLQKLSSVGGKTKDKEKISNKIANIVCRTKDERTFYRFTNNMIKNEREFKLRVYPSLGFSIVFPFIMLFNSARGSSLAQVINSKAYFNTYFVAFFLPSLMQFIGNSGNYKGAWIYKVAPIKKYEPVFKGAVKSVFINLFTPVILIVSIIFLIVFKFKILNHLIIVYLNLILGTFIVFKLFKKDLPFSRAFETTERRNGFGKTLLSIMGMGILILIHYFSMRIRFGQYIYLLIQIIIIYVSSRFIFNVQPDD
ncbi:MAG: hypothetical protein RIN55_02645 [Tissierellaceae bacterium]|nr:hypothetical protein [Tissierellaceae bacterium]